MSSLVEPQTVAAKTLRWFEANARILPWRARPGETPDPYRVWLSEILLQQTTTTGAAPYFLEFLRRWPHVEALAAAPWDDVMSVFAGLGYYSRARNLHACAKAVAAAGGRFPKDEAALRALPGVGPYTAAAVAAIAFGAPATPVDGNIARIVSRLAAFDKPVAANRRAIETFAATLTPAQGAGDFAQALMDLGATICRPRAPACLACPLREDCRAAASGAPETYPGRPAKKLRPQKVGAAFFAARADGAFLARRRPERGLLAGTMELPGGAWTVGEIESVDAGAAPFPARWTQLDGHVAHVFSHFTLRLALFRAAAPRDAPEGLAFIGPQALETSGFSGLMRKAVRLARASA